jgi:hypothetical protein
MQGRHTLARLQTPEGGRTVTGLGAVAMVAVVIGLLLFIVILRPAWTWLAVLCGAVLVADRAELPSWPAVAAVAGVWLLWQAGRLVWAPRGSA